MRMRTTRDACTVRSELSRISWKRMTYQEASSVMLERVFTLGLMSLLKSKEDWDKNTIGR